MPELAEVEYYRKRWDEGLNHKVLGVSLHSKKRIFRDVNASELKRLLTGTTLMRSEARGKEMLFRFSRDVWVGIHLGMTGHLRSEAPDFKPAKHDHLTLKQKSRALIFSDMRQFGRVRLHHGVDAPAWWTRLPQPLDSKAFTTASMNKFLLRHRRLAIKAALLLQAGFPGVGNWMADEILWRARIHPRKLSGTLTEKEMRRVWAEVRFVCREALRKVGKDFGDPPDGWLFHARWKRKGICPRHDVELKRESIGGRTSAWCPICQK